MKRLFAWIFGWPLVWTRDHWYCFGNVRLRRVYQTPYGNRICGVLSSRIGWLQPDGTIIGPPGTYMESWKPANKKAEGLFK
jgi:hypothetical protein